MLRSAGLGQLDRQVAWLGRKPAPGGHTVLGLGRLLLLRLSGREGWLRVLGRRGQDCTVSATLTEAWGQLCLFASHGSRVWWEHFAS